MTQHRIYTMKFSAVYPMYVQKAERKGRTKQEVDEVTRWLTGFSQSQLEQQIERQTTFEQFFDEAPMLNPLVSQIKGIVCGIRVEDIEDPLMRKVRCLDKLVDELAKGKSMDKVLRA